MKAKAQVGFIIYSFTSRRLCTNQSSFHPPPPPCISHTVATLMPDYWAVYEPPSDLPCVCYTPYNIGNNNSVQRPRRKAPTLTHACLKKPTRVAAPLPRASLGRRTVCGRTEQRRPPVSKRYENKVRMVWGSFLIAAAALKTPTRNGYNAQGVNLTCASCTVRRQWLF